MRFTARGPAIPIELLTARDQGEVVFFCGAGVSKPAGLLTFFELTVQVMKKVGVSPNSKLGMQMASAIANNDPDLAPPFDQIFGILQRNYTTEKVEREVNRLLKTPRKPLVQNHEIILRLSRDVNGSPFVVTTNFDHLFERARPRIKRWVPPMLPLMAGDELHSGVVYLHGRLGRSTQSSALSNKLVLGSADFGRAYLADGWATNFIRQLLERRVVVLLGYSAGDPPIRYLLEGLYSSTSAKLRPIYAFDRGDESEVRSKWNDLGATGIPFDHFDDLWASLSSWAERADDPVEWRRKVLAQAHKSPRSLEPFQRGQIAAIAGTPDGAKSFAETVPPPCAEWLCVLDRNVRYAQPFDDGYGDDTVEIDPLTEYGLDDDPQRSLDGSKGQGGIDFLANLPSDTDSDMYFRLAGISPTRRGFVLRRLWSLSRWFEAIAHEPVAIWWASRQINLHPDLLWVVNRRLTGHGEKFEDEVWNVWHLLSEVEDQKSDDVHDLGWYDFVAILKRGGWNASTLRAFQKAIAPRLKVDTSASWTIVPLLPAHKDGDYELKSLVRFSVHCPNRHGHGIDIPDNILGAVVSIINGTLETIIGMLEVTGSLKYFHLPAIEPDGRPGERYISENSPKAQFLWAVQLFERLAQSSPDQALRELEKWPTEDRIFFDKFRLFAWKIDGLCTADAIVRGILQLQSDSFWDPYLQRDLLHLLRSRWNDFAQEDREAIEERIYSPPEFELEDDQSKVERRRYYVGTRLGWLDSNQCSLSAKARLILEEYRRDSDWREAAERGADHDYDGRAGWVERRTDPSDLKGVPLSQIVAKAVASSASAHEHFVELAPFDGLIEQNPRLALAALAYEARRGTYPIALWSQLLSKWPKDTSPRLSRLCAKRLARLPVGTLVELRSYSTGWMDDHFSTFASSHPPEYFALWDALFDAFQIAGEDAVASGLGDTTIGGKVVKESRKTLDHAINAPIGRLVESLFSTVRNRKFKRNEGLDSDISSRLERCLTSIGEGADHTTSLIAQRLNWLYFVDREWALAFVVPMFALSSPHSEAAWNGLLFRNMVPQPVELFAILKPSFLRLFEEGSEWLTSDRDERHAVTVLLVATYWNRKHSGYVSDSECRLALQSVDDVGRQQALRTLHDVCGKADAWRTFGRRFFSDIWPQEARFQSGATSETMLHIAEDKPDMFPEVIQVIQDYLRPIDPPDLFIFRHRREDDDGQRRPLAHMWPNEVLAVADRVIAIKPTYIPHELSALLSDIAEADPTTRNSRAWRRLHDLVSA